MKRRKKILEALLFLVIFTLFASGVYFSIGRIFVIPCGKNYDCLQRSITNGRAAKVSTTERVEALSLEEKSEVVITPKNGKFEIKMRVLKITPLDSSENQHKALLDSTEDDCIQLRQNPSKLENTSAICTTETARQAGTLAQVGLSTSSIREYSCSGTLVDILQLQCSFQEQTAPGLPLNLDVGPVFKKPAIYLYPEQQEQVRVKVAIKGAMTLSEPKYGDGWTVLANPSGLIDEKYDYLFYEAQLDNLELPEEGWVVPGNNLSPWFEEYLQKLGLNEKEKTQFKEYWLAELPESAYYEIHLLERDFLNKNMKLKIVPQPQTIIRLNFSFQPLTQDREIIEPTIKIPQRKGFTVVEWGGVIVP